MTTKSFNYGGRSYFYDESSLLCQFHVEIGRYENEYITEMIFHNPQDAIAHYENITVENGYKKRLVYFNGDNKHILAREISKRASI